MRINYAILITRQWTDLWCQPTSFLDSFDKYLFFLKLEQYRLRVPTQTHILERVCEQSNSGSGSNLPMNSLCDGSSSYSFGKVQFCFRHLIFSTYNCFSFRQIFVLLPVGKNRVYLYVMFATRDKIARSHKGCSTLICKVTQSNYEILFRIFEFLLLEGSKINIKLS